MDCKDGYVMKTEDGKPYMGQLMSGAPVECHFSPEGNPFWADSEATPVKCDKECHVDEDCQESCLGACRKDR